MIDIIQVGLGPIGLGVVRSVASRRDARIVAAIDPSPAVQSKGWAGLIPEGPSPGVCIDTAPDPRLLTQGRIAVVATASSLQTLEVHARPFLEAGLPVVSSCEELANPWQTDPERASRLDDLSKRHDVAIVGAGVNPGFLMDYWPLAASAVCSRVNSIHVERFQDAANRRLPFQQKIGAGKSKDDFDQLVAQGLIRHVGLTESMHAIAAGLGWELTRTEDVVECAVAERDVCSAELSVPKGAAAGVYQHGHGYVADQEVITLTFRATIGEKRDFDRVTIKGEPSLTVEIPGGVPGDAATCNILVNAASVIARARPGLRTMTEIPTPSCCR